MAEDYVAAAAPPLSADARELGEHSQPAAEEQASRLAALAAAVHFLVDTAPAQNGLQPTAQDRPTTQATQHVQAALPGLLAVVTEFCSTASSAAQPASASSSTAHSEPVAASAALSLLGRAACELAVALLQAAPEQQQQDSLAATVLQACASLWVRPCLHVCSIK